MLQTSLKKEKLLIVLLNKANKNIYEEFRLRQFAYGSQIIFKKNSLSATFLEKFTLSCLLETDNLARRKPRVYLKNIKAKMFFYNHTLNTKVLQFTVGFLPLFHLYLF